MVHGQKGVMNPGEAVPWSGVQSLGGQVMDWWAQTILWRTPRAVHRMLILFLY